MTMRARPRLLDLFCGAGGAAMGYYRAGFDVIGVDLNPQPHYPFEFYQADALTFEIRGAHAVHASPPCQHYSRMRSVTRGQYPDLVAATRDWLEAAGVPWVIENVPGAPLRDPVELCGLSFGLNVIRHRLFESPVCLLAPAHGAHRPGTYSPTGHGDPNWRERAAFPHLRGRGYTQRCREAMGVDWMTRDELAQSIPPAYTEHIGKQLIAVC